LYKEVEKKIHDGRDEKDRPLFGELRRGGCFSGREKNASLEGRREVDDLGRKGSGLIKDNQNGPDLGG
jgi:hypothetical protein